MKKIVLAAMLALPLAACGGGGERPDPEIGVAPAAQMPALPNALAQKAERLPDITDPSLGGIHRDGAQSDSRYNDLAYRYNFMVDAWGCVRQHLNSRSTDEEALNRCFEGTPQ